MGAQMTLSKNSILIKAYRDRGKPRDPPLPHHPAYGSVPRRFGWSGNPFPGINRSGVVGRSCPEVAGGRSSLPECSWASPRGGFGKNSSCCFADAFDP